MCLGKLALAAVVFLWGSSLALAQPNDRRTSGDTRVNSVDGLTYVHIPPGTFVMGCSPGDTGCSSDEKSPQSVSIDGGFWLGQTEVTQAAWAKVMGGDPSHFKGDQKLPVEMVNWNEASTYCQKINGRLPTEEEWEYSARAGTRGVRYGTLDDIAWYGDNSGGKTHPVGLKQANVFGLYDMLGNVWEWTSTGSPFGPLGKIKRGGAWSVAGAIVRASVRDGYGASTNRSYAVGFRCVGEFR